MNINNGCINVTASYIGDKLSLNCSKLNEGLSVNSTYLSSKLNATVQYKNVRLKVRCGMICSMNEDFENYLLVREGIFILSDGKKFELKR